MNAREHAEHASRLAEAATEHYDDERRTYALEYAELAQAHALAALALLGQPPQLLFGQDRKLVDELAPGPNG